MTTTNDITGDALRSRPSNDNFNDNFDRIFGKKDNALDRGARSEPNTVEAETSTDNTSGDEHTQATRDGDLRVGRDGGAHRTDDSGVV